MYRAYHTKYSNSYDGFDRKLFFDTYLDIAEYKLIDPTLNRNFGKAGSFTFRVPITNTEYEKFEDSVSYIELYRKDKLIFYGRVFGQQKDFDNIYNVTCEGFLAVLNDSVSDAIVVQNISMEDLVRLFLDWHNSQVDGYKRIEVGRIEVYTKGLIDMTFDRKVKTIQRLDEISEAYGGYFLIRYENGTAYLDYIDHHTLISDQEINFGENLLSIDQSTVVEDLCTVLVANGADDVDPVTVENKDAIESYGLIVNVKDWPDVHETEVLERLANNYLESVCKPKININVTAVDLSKIGTDINFFDVGQEVKVRSKLHNIDDMFVVQSQEIRLLEPQSNTLSLGGEKYGYISKVKQNTNSTLYTILNTVNQGSETTIHHITNADIDRLIDGLS